QMRRWPSEGSGECLWAIEPAARFGHRCRRSRRRVDRNMRLSAPCARGGVGASQRFCHQMLDDLSERLLAGTAFGQRGAEAVDLAIGRGAARNNGARVLEFGEAPERACVLAHHGDELLNEYTEGNKLALAEVEQRAAHPVALGAPAVLRE